MTWMRASGRWLTLFLLCWLVGGCAPSGNPIADEERDPHILAGEDRIELAVDASDYRAAVRLFEKALQNNPQSSAAHLRLGMVYCQQIEDWAAAIYHFQRYLELRPDANNAAAVRQRVQECKTQLVWDVPFAPINHKIQERLEKLSEENQQLQREVAQLRSGLARAQRPPSNPPVGTPDRSTRNRTESVRQSTPREVRTTRPPDSTTVSSRPRTHKVARGETFYSLANHYGVSVAALRAANPGVDVTNLQIGQILRIPAR